MLLSFNNLILTTFLFLSFYWTFFNVGRHSYFYKKISLIAVSSLMIFLFNPLILLLLVGFTAYCYLCFLTAIRFKKTYLLWIIFIPLFISNFISFHKMNLPVNLFGNPLSDLTSNTIFLGFSYYTIKSFGSLYYFFKNKNFNLIDFIVSNIFFPSFVIGPIDYANKFSDKVLKSDFNIVEFKTKAKGRVELTVCLLQGSLWHRRAQKTKMSGVHRPLSGV